MPGWEAAPQSLAPEFTSLRTRVRTVKCHNFAETELWAESCPITELKVSPKGNLRFSWWFRTSFRSSHITHTHFGSICLRHHVCQSALFGRTSAEAGALASVVCYSPLRARCTEAGPRECRVTQVEFHNCVFTKLFTTLHPAWDNILELRCLYPCLFICLVTLLSRSAAMPRGSWRNWSEIGLNINTPWHRPHRSADSTSHDTIKNIPTWVWAEHCQEHAALQT